MEKNNQAQKSDVKVVFAEFPDWKKLTKAEKDTLFEQMCRLWKESEHDKAKQLLGYLFDNGYDDRKLDEFVETTDADFQYYYGRKLTDVSLHGDFAKARYWLGKAAQSGYSEAKWRIQDLNSAIMDEISDRLEEINRQIAEAYRKKGKDGFFMGEESAVLNENGHIEFIKKELCLWDCINGAMGLILAKDKPVERSKFKMTGFSPELKVIMTQISQDESERNCYPNIIEYSITRKDESGGYTTDDFQTEARTWTVLMQLLNHGYSLVEKEEYTNRNSKMLPKVIQDEIKEAQYDFIEQLTLGIEDFDDDDQDGTHGEVDEGKKTTGKKKSNKKKK